MEAAQASLRELLVNLVKLALVDDQEVSSPRRAAAIASHGELGPPRTACLLEGRSLDQLWSAAVREAEGDSLVKEREDIDPTLPAACPFALAELPTPVLQLEACVRRVREIVSFG